MDVRVRDCTPADLDACLAVFDTNLPDFFTEGERPQFEAFLKSLPGPYFVLEDATGALVGCGGYAVEQGSTTADLCWGMVARDRQGRGLGRLLAEVRLSAIRRDPAVAEVALRTGPSTVAFYERLGFVTERVVPDGIAPGVDRCEMRQRLTR